MKIELLNIFFSKIIICRLLIVIPNRDVQILLSIYKKKFPQVILSRVSDSEGMGSLNRLLFGYPGSAQK